MNTIKKHWKKIIVVIFIIIIIAIIIKFGINAYENYRHDLLDNPAWLRENIKFVKNDEGVYEIERNEDISIFSENYQSIIEEKIAELKDSADYTLENPLITLFYYSFYIQFKLFSYILC